MRASVTGHSSRARYLALLMVYAAAPFVFYYIWFIADHLTSAVLIQNRELHLSISRPEHWLWFAASKFLAGLVIVFWVVGEARGVWR